MQRMLVLVSIVAAAQMAGCGGQETVAGETGGQLDTDGITVSGNQIRINLTSEQGSVLASDGGFVFVEEARTIIINEAGSIRAFTSVCTGDGCDVNRFSNHQMLCSCDGSTFSNAGLPIQGAASAPLSRYTVAQNGDVVTVVMTSSSGNPNPNPDPDPDPYPPDYYY